MSDPPYAFEKNLFLEPDLSGILNMLPVAASTNGVVRTSGRDSFRDRTEHLECSSRHPVPFSLRYFSPNKFSG